MSDRLTVAVDARLPPGQWGGVEQVVLGLAQGLSGLEDGREEYVFLTWQGDDGWLTPSLAGPCRALPCPPPPPPPAAGARAALARLPGARRLWHGLHTTLARPGLPASPGTAESAGADVVHFPFQRGFLTDLPTIYMPYDLQHVHLPEHFTGAERREREARYGALCRQAAFVAVMTEWARRDVVAHFGIDPAKVVAVPGASAAEAYPVPTAAEADAAARRLALPGRFLLYPAQTWPHKNHVRLLEAVRAMVDRGHDDVTLICSGRRNEHFPAIERARSRLGLDRHVRFVGHVAPVELQVLLRRCTGVVFPTTFEGWGMPLFDAFTAGAPLACSAVTSLPEHAGDAALLFDPRSVDAIAAAMTVLWTDAGERERLRERGRRRAAAFSWHRTATDFRALYRAAAGRPLGDGDAARLAAMTGAGATAGATP